MTTECKKTYCMYTHKNIFDACLLKQEGSNAFFSVNSILEFLHDEIKEDLIQQGEKESEDLEDTVNMIALEYFDTYITPFCGEGVNVQYVLDTEEGPHELRT